jgi:hypothetical protein
LHQGSPNQDFPAPFDQSPTHRNLKEASRLLFPANNRTSFFASAELPSLNLKRLIS